MRYPAGYKYTKDHEWIEIAGDSGKVGITDYAQQQLGDVVYIDLPEVGTRLKAGQSFGTIESVKAVSELYAPVAGEVVEVNSALKDKPEAVNTESARQLDDRAQACRCIRNRRPARRGPVRRPREMSIFDPESFQSRHIGPSPADAAAMLKVVRRSLDGRAHRRSDPGAHSPGGAAEACRRAARIRIPSRSSGDRVRAIACSSRTSASATTTASRRA